MQDFRYVFWNTRILGMCMHVYSNVCLHWAYICRKSHLCVSCMHFILFPSSCLHISWHVPVNWLHYFDGQNWGMFGDPKVRMPVKFWDGLSGGFVRILERSPLWKGTTFRFERRIGRNHHWNKSTDFKQKQYFSPNGDLIENSPFSFRVKRVLKGLTGLTQVQTILILPCGQDMPRLLGKTRSPGSPGPGRRDSKVWRCESRWSFILQFDTGIYRISFI